MRIVAVEDLRRGPGAALFEGADHGSPAAFFMIDFAPGEGSRMHRHPYAETFLVHSGEATFTIEGRDAFENAGDGALALTSIAPADQVAQEDVESG